MKKTLNIIAGVDEVGRGALAGPVVSGACVLLSNRRIHPLIRDSKTLSAKQRREAFEWIKEHCLVGIGRAEAEEIDEMGILRCTHLSMLRAIENLEPLCKPDQLLVDGRDAFSFPIPHTSIIRGDSIKACIAAASIAAKVTRDEWMISISETYGSYGFESHKGYGTAAHFEAIRREGPCDMHRQSFLRSVVLNGKRTSAAKNPKR